MKKLFLFILLLISIKASAQNLDGLQMTHEWPKHKQTALTAIAKARAKLVCEGSINPDIGKMIEEPLTIVKQSNPSRLRFAQLEQDEALFLELIFDQDFKNLKQLFVIKSWPLIALNCEVKE